LRDFAALCQKARVFVGNESGPMHIAAASQIPTIGLFGPGEPPIFAPHGKKATYIHHKLECNPCDQIHCIYPENPCINRISVAEVKEKIVELLLESK
jgi:ADP-heptose:LPS heptosyltransferase